MNIILTKEHIIIIVSVIGGIIVLAVVVVVLVKYLPVKKSPPAPSTIPDPLESPKVSPSGPPEAIDSASPSPSQEIFVKGSPTSKKPSSSPSLGNTSSQSSTMPPNNTKEPLSSPLWSECAFTHDCPSGMICFNSTCTYPPRDWNAIINTGYNDHQLCLNAHLMVLNDDKFTMLPSWWSLDGCQDICSGLLPDTVFVLTAKGIVLVNTNHGPRSVIQGTEVHGKTVSKLFVFRGALHVLAEGVIYRGPTSRELGDTLIWDPIEFLYGRDISKEYIIAVDVSERGLINLTCPEYHLYYNIEGWNMIPSQDKFVFYQEGYAYLSQEPCKTVENVYRFFNNTPVPQEISEILKKIPKGVPGSPLQEKYYGNAFNKTTKDTLVFGKYGEPPTLIPRVIDAVYDSKKGDIAILNKEGIVKYVSSGKILNGLGVHLFVANGFLWLLSNEECYSI